MEMQGSWFQNYQEFQASHSRALKQTWDLRGGAWQGHTGHMPTMPAQSRGFCSCSKEPSAQGLWLHFVPGLSSIAVKHHQSYSDLLPYTQPSASSGSPAACPLPLEGSLGSPEITETSGSQT